MFRQRANRDRLVEESRRLRAGLAQVTRERDAALTAAQSQATDRLEFLFIVTYGRSGSTLLMGLLNALDGFCLRGENNGVLYDLFQFQSKAVEARATQTQEEQLTSTSPWYGIDEYPAELAAARIRQLVIDTLLRPEPGTRVTGFKEVRWWLPKLVEYLDFVEEVFPGARFVLNTRNLDDVAQSSWHRTKPDARIKLEEADAGLRQIVGNRGDRAYHVHYDDYVSDPSVLRGLYEWLGAEYDPERVAEVLSVEHSFSSRPKTAPAG